MDIAFHLKLQNNFSGNKEVVLQLDDQNPNEALILNFLRAGMLYEPDIMKIIQKILEPGDVFFDVGANIGYFTQFGSALVGPEGKVFAFEPDPKNIERITFHCDKNHCSNVQIISRPASHSVEDVNFYFNKKSSGGNALWNPGESFGDAEYGGGYSTMKSTTLSDEIANFDIKKLKLVKIDTEGAEHAILRGAGEWLTAETIPFIIAEVNGYGLNQLGTSKNELIEFMYSRGYLAFLLYLDGRPPQFVGPGVNFTSLCMSNVLFTTPQGFAKIWSDMIHDPGVVIDKDTGEMRAKFAA